MRLLLRVLLVTLAPAAAADPAAAQSAPAENRAAVTVQGRVLDPMQMGIAGASVTASASRGPEVAASTDQTGPFTLTLPAGHYSLRISAPGFADAVQPVAIDTATR